MKSKILLIIGLLLLFGSQLSSQKEVKGITTKVNPPQGTISVLSSPDLYNLTSEWAGEYCRLNPGVKINIIRVADGEPLTFSNTGANLGFVSKDYYTALNRDPLWKMIVGRDVIVPVINLKNPFLKEINKQGINWKALARLFNDHEQPNWGTLLNNGQNVPVNVYILNEESVKLGLSSFMRVDQSVFEGIKTENVSEDLISRIQNDPYSIGFCKINNILDESGKEFTSKVQFLPIDKNLNGHLDYIECIYDDLYEFLRGIWMGKYPRVLSSNIYSVSEMRPTHEAELGFLNWVLGDGQKFLILNGYFQLVDSERQSQLSNLFYIPAKAESVQEAYPPAIALALPVLILTAVILLGIGMIAVLSKYRLVGKSRKSGKKGLADTSPYLSTTFHEGSVKVPRGLYFDKSHTWAFMEKDGLVKVGIGDFLQHITGAITHIKMRNPGEKVKKGESLLTIIQNGKQLNIYAPVSGIIRVQNTLLISDTTALNSSPYSDGWVYMLEPTKWFSEIRVLTMAEKYQEWVKKEFARLKEFVAGLDISNNVEGTPVLQDGGELKDGVLADFGPMEWEEFQIHFIDRSK